MTAVDTIQKTNLNSSFLKLNYFLDTEDVLHSDSGSDDHKIKTKGIITEIELNLSNYVLMLDILLKQVLIKILILILIDE